MKIVLRNYICGISWFLLSLVSSSLNDILSKYGGLRLHPAQVAFFRFMFSAITLVPFVIYYGKETLKTTRPFVHCARGVLLFFGMTAWTYGLTVAHVTTGTVISFAIPLFTLVLATFFLNENIILPRWIVTFIGFFGIVITLNVYANDFNTDALIFVVAAIAFAMLDIINKKFVVQESMISMLFYSAVITALLSAPVSYFYWQSPTVLELSLLFLLGISANLILFFLLKAFSLVDVSASAPYRYLELLLSSVAGFVVFNEIPEKSTIIGALIIAPATLFIIYSEKKNMDKNQ